MPGTTTASHRRPMTIYFKVDEARQREFMLKCCKNPEKCLFIMEVNPNMLPVGLVVQISSLYAL